MSASVLPVNTLFADYFRVDSPYITVPPAALESKAVCLLPYQKDLKAEEQKGYNKEPQATIETTQTETPVQRNTVRFAEDTKPHTNSTFTMTSNINNQPGHAKSASAGSNRSASRSDPRGNRTVEPCELTAVDKKWGELFTSDGLPTARFVDAMTSLSRYIVSCKQVRKQAANNFGRLF